MPVRQSPSATLLKELACRARVSIACRSLWEDRSLLLTFVELPIRYSRMAGLLWTKIGALASHLFRATTARERPNALSALAFAGWKTGGDQDLELIPFLSSYQKRTEPMGAP